MTGFGRPYRNRKAEEAQRRAEELAPQRPSNTDDPNVRVPKDRTPYDYPAQEDKLPEVTGYVPSAPDPVPVYIVQTAPARRSLTRRASGNLTLPENSAHQVSGVDTRRTRAWFRNLDAAASAYIMNDPNSLLMFGIILEPGQDVNITDTDELWIRSGAATVDVTWSLEYEVDE